MKFKKSRHNGNLLVELEPSHLPLLRNPEAPIMDLKKLLVPIDFSECSRQAIKYAIAFAKQFDAEITLLAVIHDPQTTFEYGSAEFAQMQEGRRNLYKQELKKLASQELGALKHRILVREGRPFEEIVGEARDSDQDLIIISTHGDMGLTRVDLGSTAERVIRYASCPVFVVRPIEREFVR